MGASAPSLDTPLVLIGHQGRKRVVLAADQAARHAGLSVGMPATKAQALVEGLSIFDADPEADGEALYKLAVWMQRHYAPLVTAYHPDGMVLDITGVAHLFGGEGYAVQPVAADIKRSDFLKTYPTASANQVDSYLDIVVTSYGYAAAGMGDASPYRPWLLAKVKLIKASSGRVLLEDMISYNSLFTIKNVVTLSPDPAYAFPAWSDANADAKKTADGVAEAASKSAVAIADLAK